MCLKKTSTLTSSLSSFPIFFNCLERRLLLTPQKVTSLLASAGDGGSTNALMRCHATLVEKTAPPALDLRRRRTSRRRRITTSARSALGGGTAVVVRANNARSALASGSNRNLISKESRIKGITKRSIVPISAISAAMDYTVKVMT